MPEMRSIKLSNRTLPVKKRGVLPAIATRLFHRFQERVRTPRHRATLAWLASLLRPRIAIEQTVADRELIENGVILIPQYLSAEQCAQLYVILNKMPCTDPWKPHRGSFMIDDAPPETHVADIGDAAAIEALHDIAFDKRLVEIAAQYFGCRPYVDSIQAWWSLPGNDEPEEAENFHRDNDSIRFLKFFLYLTDVTEGHGPHKFVRGSHSDSRLLERRRLTDDEVEQAFGNNQIMVMTANAGDAFIEDTFGIHKGQLPETGRRLLVQVRYSVSPTVFRSPIVVASPLPKHVVADSLLH